MELSGNQLLFWLFDNQVAINSFLVLMSKNLVFRIQEINLIS